MKKRWRIWVLIVCMLAAVAGCAGAGDSRETTDGQTVNQETESGPAAGQEMTAGTTASQETAAGTMASQETAAGTTVSQETTAETTANPTANPADETNQERTIRVGSLKGPTSMGLVGLMERAQKGETESRYEFTMATAADEINAAFLRGELDIVLIPANVASVLYNKTEGQLAVLNINTLGVLYVLENGETVQSIADLAGRTVYLPGKGTTPDYALQYILAQNGLTDEVDLQYKAEAAEVISALSEDTAAIGLLPQPAATTACMQNEGLRIALDLTQEWDRVSEDGSLVTGVTVVRRAFLEENEAAVQEFLREHADSAAFVNEHIEEAAELVARLEIVPKAPVAAKAIPYCNITCVTGEEMRTALSGYLHVLYGQNPEAVGGKEPGEDFYYEP